MRCFSAAMVVGIVAGVNNPNIVLILADDQSSFFGDNLEHMPNLKALIVDGEGSTFLFSFS
jgi:hypothetical protein